MNKRHFIRFAVVLATSMAVGPLLAACGGGAGGGVSSESCGAVQSGQSRSEVNATLGNAGGGGGGDGWCDIWFGDYAAGPCCAVALNDCGGGGTVTGVAFYAGGCTGQPAP